MEGWVKEDQELEDLEEMRLKEIEDWETHHTELSSVWEEAKTAREEEAAAVFGKIKEAW